MKINLSLLKAGVIFILFAMYVCCVAYSITPLIQWIYETIFLDIYKLI